MMNAVVCVAPGQLSLERRPIPLRGADEVLIRVRNVGVCGTDMHIFRGTQPYLSYPRIMGHELSGEVVEAPSDSQLKAGDPVYVMPYLSCGTCSACRKGRPNCCTKLEVLGVHRDGGMAEFLTVPADFVFKADGVSLGDAAMIEFLAIGAHAVRRVEIQPGSRVLVVGAGPIGIAAALFATLRGADVTTLDGRNDRLEFCRDVLGVRHSVRSDNHTTQRLKEITQGTWFDVVFDATGNSQAMETGFSYVGQGGSYVLVSIVNANIAFSDPEFHRREMTLLGSRNATAADFEQVLWAMREGKVPTRALNTHRVELSRVPEVLPTWLAASAGIIKGIVDC
jgi:2-desacetyl-2-hydroxyethyl bacteriochlorophyllide A dehydrogenase